MDSQNVAQALAKTRLSLVENRDHRGVVGRCHSVLFLSEIPVDFDRDQSIHDGLRAEQEIDSKPVFSVEGACSIIPPAERLRLRFQHAEEIS